MNAQTSGVSPYSAYGLGDLSSPGFTPQLSMGQLALPIVDPANINVSNPATYGYLQYTIFDVGMASKFLSISTEQGSAEFTNSKARNIALAFPIVREKWGMSIGLLPVSNVGYELLDSEMLDSTSSVNYQYAGEGGLNRFYMGVGGKVWQKPKSILSAGVNFSYIFGSVEKVRKAIYPTDEGYYNTRTRESLRVKDLSYDLGLHYSTILVEDSLQNKEWLKKKKARTKLKLDGLNGQLNLLRFQLDSVQPRLDSLQKDSVQKIFDKFKSRSSKSKRKMSRLNNKWRKIDLLLGATYIFGSNLHAEVSLLTETFAYGTGEVEFPRDTIEFIDEERGTVFIPELISFGVGVKFNNKFTVGTELHLRDWRKYSTTFDVEETSKAKHLRSSRYSLGMEYYPLGNHKKAERAKFFSAMKYRMGFRYLESYLQLNDKQLSQYGISFGVGIPLLKAHSNSWLSIGGEVGERGTHKNDLLKEQYVNLYFGLTIAPLKRDKWFRKNKID